LTEPFADRAASNLTPRRRVTTIGGDPRRFAHIQSFSSQRTETFALFVESRGSVTAPA